MKGSAWGNWDPQESLQPFRPNPNGVGDGTITLRRQSIGAGLLPLLFAIAVNVIFENAREELMNKILYADDLVLMNESMKKLKKVFKMEKRV